MLLSQLKFFLSIDTFQTVVGRVRGSEWWGMLAVAGNLTKWKINTYRFSGLHFTCASRPPSLSLLMLITRLWNWIASPRMLRAAEVSVMPLTPCTTPDMIPASKKSKIRAENGSCLNLSLTPAFFSLFLAVAPSIFFLGPVCAALLVDSVKWLLTWRSSIAWNEW